MGKETKIGLAVIALLLSVFGVVVYLKIDRAPTGPSNSALAADLDGQQTADVTEPSTTGSPSVQLPAAADSSAPIEVPVGTTAGDTGDYDAMPAVGEVAPPQPDWNATPGSSRRGYVDVVEAETPPSAAELAAETAVDEPLFAAGGAPDQLPLDDGRMPEFDGDRATTGLDSVASDDQTMPAEYEDPSAPQDTPFAEGSLAEEPIDEQPLHRPDDVNHWPGEAMQVAAEEPAAEPPTELDESAAAPAAAKAAPSSRVRPRSAPAVAAPIEQPEAYTPPPRASSQATKNFQRPDGSYAIEPNDNYYRISEKIYGTGSYFKALFEHNRQQFPRADRLQYGDVISVPPVESLERTYPDLCPRPQHRQVEEKITRAVSGRRLPRGSQVYIVEEGDTLFDIARYTLGNASRWGEIYDLNREVLGEQVDHLKPGMELALPSTTQPSDNIAREPAGRLR